MRNPVYRGGCGARNLQRLARAVRHNCEISDARHAADYGMCVFLLKMREYFRWEKRLAFGAQMPRGELGRWLSSRERRWQKLEQRPFAPLPVGGTAVDAFDVAAVNRFLLPCGAVYAAGYGPFLKPVFFLGRLERVEQRGSLTLILSSGEQARELAAPPAMLLGRDIFVRLESVRRYLWEKIEEWQWRRPDGAMARALDAYGFADDAQGALGRMTEDQAEIMVLHEMGEAAAGALLGPGWPAMAMSLARTSAEGTVRAVRDLLADCLSTLPALAERGEVRQLHLYFATFEARHRRMFPEAVEGYEHLVRGLGGSSLAKAAQEGSGRWLAQARRLLSAEPAERSRVAAALADAR